MNKIIELIDRLDAINREMKDSNERLTNLLWELRALDSEENEDEVIGVGDPKVENDEIPNNSNHE